MTRTVTCRRYGSEEPGLEHPPFPGSEGQRIFDQVSQRAWEEWIKLQTVLINEHRLTPFETNARNYLKKERDKYLFGGEVSLPDAFKPSEKT